MLLCSSWRFRFQPIEMQVIPFRLDGLPGADGGPERRHPAEAGCPGHRRGAKPQLRKSWWQALQPSPIFEVAARTPSQFTGGAPSTPSSVARMLDACFA